MSDNAGVSESGFLVWPSGFEVLGVGFKQPRAKGRVSSSSRIVLMFQRCGKKSMGLAKCNDSLTMGN